MITKSQGSFIYGSEQTRREQTPREREMDSQCRVENPEPQRREKKIQ